MHHPALGHTLAVEHLEHLVVGVAVVDDQRLVEPLGEVDVPAEGLDLRRPPVLAGAEVVEPGLPDRAHLVVRLREQLDLLHAPRRGSRRRPAAAPRWGAARHRRPAASWVRAASTAQCAPGQVTADLHDPGDPDGSRPRRSRPRRPNQSSPSAMSRWQWLSTTGCGSGSGAGRPLAVAARAALLLGRRPAPGRLVASSRREAIRARIASANGSGAWAGIQWLTPSSTHQLVGTGDPPAADLGAGAGQRDVAVAPDVRRRDGDLLLRPPERLERQRAVPRRARRTGRRTRSPRGAPGPRPGGSCRPCAGRCRTARRRCRATHSARNGSTNREKYHDRRSWSPRTHAVRNAAGCGTDTAVRLRTRSGRRAARPHATVAPQSWPARWTGLPRSVDQRLDVGDERRQPVRRPEPRPGARRVAALVGGEGAQPVPVQPGGHRVPGRGTLGPSVEQHDRVAVERSLVADVEGQPSAPVGPGSRRGVIGRAPGCTPRASGRRPAAPPRRSPPCAACLRPRARRPRPAGSPGRCRALRRGVGPGDHDRDLAADPVVGPGGELGEPAAAYLLMGLGELAAHGAGPVGTERLGHRRERGRGAVRCLEEHHRPLLGGERGQPAGPLPRLARQEPLEAEPVDGQPGDGEGGEHGGRARARR